MYINQKTGLIRLTKFEKAAVHGLIKLPPSLAPLFAEANHLAILGEHLKAKVKDGTLEKDEVSHLITWLDFPETCFTRGAYLFFRKPLKDNLKEFPRVLIKANI